MKRQQRWRWLWRGDLPAAGVRVEFNSEPQVLPEGLETEIEDAWRRRLADAKEQVLFDGPLTQYLGHSFQDETLLLKLARTRYAHWSFSSGRQAGIESQFGAGTASRPLAMCAALWTPDGGLLIQQRSQRVAEGAGQFHVPGGHLDPDTHLLDGKPDPTTAMLTEIWEELGLERTCLRSGRLLGLIENLENGKPELLYTWRLEANWDEITDRWQGAEDRFECRSLSRWMSPLNGEDRNNIHRVSVPALALLSVFNLGHELH
ncbi:MAG: NUDIX hydrolase [bacterium]|nr:NUDIX hydrolase [bacterium]